MTIQELAWTLAWAASAASCNNAEQVVAPVAEKSAKLRHPTYGMTREQREQYWAEARAELRHKLLTTEPTWNEDPIDGVLRRIYRGDYNPRPWAE